MGELVTHPSCASDAQLAQQPRQIELIIFSTFASSRSIAGLVASSGPFVGFAMPDDGSAVPSELVPGVAALVPEAPPVTGIRDNDICDIPI
jgi:hypothetical protein